jgi:glycosyltransferase involved in cell wall biosynthesis
MPKKITYIISDIDKALGFEWVAEYLDPQKFDLSFILLNPGPSYLETFLIKHNIRTDRVLCRGKKDWLNAIYGVYKLLRSRKSDVIHCHLLQANIVGLTAAKLAGIPKRIYTRHHSSFHHVYFPKGVWWDKLANRLATNIIAISGIVGKVLIEWEKVNKQKVIFIPHGFKLAEFREVQEERVISFKERNRLNEGFCVGVISRFTELKGVQYIIPAFQKFLKSYPHSYLLLLNAHGDYEQEIHKMLQDLPAESYRMIKFEHDIAAAYKVMDVFVHVPIDANAEAFGQIYIEALAAGVPSIFTRSGIANDFNSNENLSIWVDYKNEEQIYKGLIILAQDQTKRLNLKEAGRSFSKQFDISVYIKKLEELYLS